MEWIDLEHNSTELLFLKALALIAAACLITPLFKRLGLGGVLGYLVAGVAVKLAFADSFAAHPEELLHFSEFGVVLFLFVIGLELKPSTLWEMRTDIFGLGLAQMAACGAVLAAMAFATGLDTRQAVIVGLGLALSSTAMVMRQLDENRERGSLHGRKAFSILLFQDLAIVPLLVLAALLAPSGDSLGMGESLGRIAVAAVAIALLIATGRYLLTPIFHLLARTSMQEIMTASALGVVIAAALLMDLVGLSYAMGAFIAGVMLADSAYRHEVEANLEPFRGLLLGLFFMAVGLSLDLETVRSNWSLIAVAAPVAMLAKGTTIFALARGFGLSHNPAVRLATSLPQHGEFGFVLFAAAVASGLLDAGISSLLVETVSVSMALSPLASGLDRWLVREEAAETLDEDFSDAGGRVLVVGFGRFGQIASQPLVAHGMDLTILDGDAERVREAARFGSRIHFGDGTRRDVLRAAGAAEAELILVCTDAPEITDEIVYLVRSEFPQARVHARAFDRRHAIHLHKLSVDALARETFDAALAFGGSALQALGETETDTAELLARVRAADEERLRTQMDEATGRLDESPVQPEPVLEPEPEPV